MHGREHLIMLRKAALARDAQVSKRRGLLLAADTALRARATELERAESELNGAYLTWTATLASDVLEPASISACQAHVRAAAHKLENASVAHDAALAARQSCAWALAEVRAQAESNTQAIVGIRRRLARQQNEAAQRQSEADAVLGRRHP
ncbi:MAG: hypothetical protein QM759_04890 [Terricaulis sp.]